MCIPNIELQYNAEKLLLIETEEKPWKKEGHPLQPGRKFTLWCFWPDGEAGNLMDLKETKLTE